MQVTKLETSKELAKIMTGESEFVWETYLDYKLGRDGKPKPIWRDWKLNKYSPIAVNSNLYKFVHAFTLDEILEKLPRGIEINGSGYLLKLDLPMKRIYYERAGYMTRIKEILFNNMSDLTEAAAGLLIWCDKGGYLK